MRGLSLSWVIPVTSALNMSIPPEELSIGITAKVNSIMPIPPSHCMVARHMCMPWLICVTSSSTLAPVVVNPDIASKKASLKLIGILQNMNGSMPNMENTTHTIAVSRKPSRLLIL